MKALQTTFSRYGFFVMLMIATLGFSLNSTAQDQGQVEDSTAVVEETEEASEKGTSIDWFEVTLLTSYVLGICVLLPLVIYTNMNEKIKPLEATPKSALSEEERNHKAEELLAHLESKLKHYTEEDGREMVTVNSGKQARLMKRTLDYINTYLCPTDEAVLEEVQENEQVYLVATQRKFTGSKWVMGAAIGILVLMAFFDISMLFSTFGLIHILGITFYYLSSRTPMYIFNKRMEWFGGSKLGLVGPVMAGLFAGMSMKHYVSHNGGAYRRDWESEGMSAIITLFIIALAALFIGLFVTLFGILNFVLNYPTSFLNPLDNEEKWFNRTFGEEDERLTAASA